MAEVVEDTFSVQGESRLVVANEVGDGQGCLNTAAKGDRYGVGR